MRSLQKYKSIVLSVAVLASAVGTLAAPMTAAALAPSAMTTFAAKCPDITNSKTAVEQLNEEEVDGGACIIQRYINPLIRFLAAAAGVITVFAIVAAGIQYSSAGGDPSKVAAARNRITQAVIALLAFIFLLAFLNWVVPGGINGKGGNF